MRDFRSWLGDTSSRLRRAPILSCSLLAGAIACAALAIVVDLHRQSTRDVTRGLTSLSTVLADQADRALQAMELAQEAVIQEFREAHVTDAAGYAAAASAHNLHHELRTRIASLPQVNAITILDHRGKLLNFSRYWPILLKNSRSSWIGCRSDEGGGWMRGWPRPIRPGSAAAPGSAWLAS